MLLLGGGDEEQQLADAWSLDVGTSAWAPLPAAALPSARSWHSAHMLLRDQVCHPFTSLRNPLLPALHATLLTLLSGLYQYTCRVTK